MVCELAVIILAAGRSSRFDPTGAHSKMLAKLPDGRELIRAVAESCTGVDAKRVVACGSMHRAQISEVLSDLDVQILTCPDADAGMGATLKCGIAGAQPSVGWIIMLGDMPYVRTSTIQAVADGLLDGALLVRPYLDGRPGHPAGISGKLTAEVLALPDEEGGASLFRKYADQVQHIESVDEGCMLDIDRPEDLRKAPSRGT